MYLIENAWKVRFKEVVISEVFNSEACMHRNKIISKSTCKKTVKMAFKELCME